MAIGRGTAVCKKYLKFKDTVPEKLTVPENQVDEPIWLFWNIGMDKASEIVKTCYQSIKKYAGRQVVLLTESNVQNYINMQKGRIQAAQEVARLIQFFSQ